MRALALLDTNVLVHAAYRQSTLHREAASLVALGLARRGLFCVAPQNLMEFMVVATDSRHVDPPRDAEWAARTADLLYRSRRLSKIYQKRGTILRAVREGRALGVRGARWHDLFLAATMKDA